MDVLLPQSVATVVQYYPPRRAVTASLRFLSPAGAVLASPSVTIDPLSTEVASVVDAETITVDAYSPATAEVGRWYEWGRPGSPGSRVLLAEIANVDAAEQWRIEWPVGSVAAEEEDTIKGLRCSASIGSTYTATRGENFLLEWTTTDAGGRVTVERQVAHVVRAMGRPAVDAAAARRWMANMLPGLAEDRSLGFFLDLADRASDRVWRRVRRGGRYLHLLWDASDFEASGRIALQLELFRDGLLMPAGVIDRTSYSDELERALDREIEDAISSRPYDVDDAGAVDETKIQSFLSIPARRV